MTVSMAVTNRPSTWTSNSVPRIANTPSTTITSWSRATSAVTPNFTSRKRTVIQPRIPSDPTRMRTIAWLIRSALTTAPIELRLACSKSPNFACRAFAITPRSPSLGIWVLLTTGATVGDGAGLAVGATLGAAVGDADGAGLAVGADDGDAGAFGAGGDVAVGATVGVAAGDAVEPTLGTGVMRTVGAGVGDGAGPGARRASFFSRVSKK